MTTMMPEQTVAKSLRSAGFKKVKGHGCNMASLGRCIVWIEAEEGTYMAGRQESEFVEEIIETKDWNRILEFLK